MQYVNDVNILEGVVHVLNTSNSMPILSNSRIELTGDVYRFLYKHVLKVLGSDKLKYAEFNENENLIKDAAMQFLDNTRMDLLNVSKEFAKQMFAIMRREESIYSCDLVTLNLSTDLGPMVAILKMDHIKKFTHYINASNESIDINITTESGLSQNGTVNAAAFILKNGEIELMVLDKTKKNETSNFFYKDFLDCTLVNNDRDCTKALINNSENWIRENLYDDIEKAERVRSTLRKELDEKEDININNLSEKLFESKLEAENFIDYIFSETEENFKVDKVYLNKKLKKRKLKIDGDIDLNIPGDLYSDPTKFELHNNSDGTIDIILKNINNYIEK